MRGLFFDEERQRWRVRLYRDKEIFWLSYHRSEQEAINTLMEAKAARKAPQPVRLERAPIIEPTLPALLDYLAWPHTEKAA